MTDRLNYNKKMGRGYQNMKTAVVFCLDLWTSLCYTWHLRAENLADNFSPLLSSLSSLSPQVVSFPLSLLFNAGIQVFAPRVLLVVLRGARCTFVLLSGPVWAQGAASRRSRTVLLSHCIPVNEGYGRGRGRSVGRAGGPRRVEISL